MEERLGLPEIEMTPNPLALTMITHVALRPANDAWQLTVAMRDQEVRFLLLHVHIDAADVSGVTQVQKGGVCLGVAHGCEDERTHGGASRAPSLARW